MLEKNPVLFIFFHHICLRKFSSNKLHSHRKGQNALSIENFSKWLWRIECRRSPLNVSCFIQILGSSAIALCNIQGDEVHSVRTKQTFHPLEEGEEGGFRFMEMNRNVILKTRDKTNTIIYASICISYRNTYSSKTYS